MSKLSFHILVSQCCGSELRALPKPHVVKRGGGASYFYNTCTSCRKLCWTIKGRMFDSAGTEIVVGDLIECPGVDENHACRWHAVYKEGRGIEVRDLGCNNVGMYDMQGDYFTRGPYWKHLDKLDDDDLDYYWQTTREEAQLNNQAPTRSESETGRE